MQAKRVNPELLRLARESRGMGQTELADAIGITQGAMSKYEAGVLSVSDEDLEKIAVALEYPPDFFTLNASASGFGSSCIYNRKRQSLPVRELKIIQATINIVRVHISRLLQGAEIDSKPLFAHMDIDEYGGSAEKIAGLVRALWRLPFGPIRNLVSAIENAGGIIFQFPFGTDKIDAVSHWPIGEVPLFFVNKDLPVDRWRYSLSHELGHLIMHRLPTPDMENEADRFASEFLMPQRDIESELEGFTLPKAARLKPLWRVSMQALARRACGLGKISGRHYRSIFTVLNKMKCLKDEPEPISPEHPTVIRDLIVAYQRDLGYGIDELSKLACSTVGNFQKLFMVEGTPRMRIVG